MVEKNTNSASPGTQSSHTDRGAHVVTDLYYNKTYTNNYTQGGTGGFYSRGR